MALAGPILAVRARVCTLLSAASPSPCVSQDWRKLADEDLERPARQCPSREILVTDGPYAETKEQVAGFDVIECASLEEAVRWAGRHPHSWMGAVEVRALVGGAPAVHLPEPSAGKTRYMMLVCTDPAADPQESARMEPVGPWVAEMDGRGIRLFGSELEAPAQARTVRVREKHPIVTDGPFAETKEQIAGFDVLECADLDEAIEAAAKHPMARVGILEVRPFRPLGD
jgi:hypothetical protein